MEISLKKSYVWYGLLLIILLASLITNLSVTMSTNIVFGDEGFYASRGVWMSESLEMLQTSRFRFSSPVYVDYFLRPPLFIFFLSSLFMLGGEILVKALMPVLSILTAMMLFLLVKRMFSLKAGVLSVFFFLIMPSLITYSILLYPEVFGLLFVVTSIYFLYRYFEVEKKKFLIFSGIIGGFAVLAEVSFLPIFLFYLLAFWIYKKDYKDFLKEAVMMGVVIFVILSPWLLIHNYYQFGNPGYNLDRFLDFPSSKKVFKEVPDLDVSGNLAGEAKGVKASVFKMGILSYIQFAYLLIPFIFGIIGLSYFILKKNKKSYFIIFLLVFLITFSFTQTGESMARNIITLVILLAVGAGIFSEKLYNYLSEFESVGKIIGVLFLIILLAWGLSAAFAKSESLAPKKQFSNSFFKVCDWIKENTDENARLMTLWGARSAYNCNRAGFWTGAPGLRDAILAANNKTYEIIRMHEIDYIFIQKFSIKREGRNRYPVEFVQYLESSPEFKKVYSYPQNCLYRREITDCSVVYKVKEEVNKTSEEIPQTLKSLQKGD